MFVVASPEHGEDVTGAGGVFASVDASTELTERLQDVHVVTAHKVLGQVHDGHHESLLQGPMGNRYKYHIVKCICVTQKLRSFKKNTYNTQ